MLVLGAAVAAFVAAAFAMLEPLALDAALDAVAAPAVDAVVVVAAVIAVVAAVFAVAGDRVAGPGLLVCQSYTD